MGIIEVLNSVVNEMTENEEEKVEKCIVSHLEHIKDEVLNEINLCEESYNTIISKYWNYYWVNEEILDDKKINELINIVYFHCLLRH